MRAIDADELEELFREVIGRIAKRPDINFNMEHMIRASAMVIEMIKDAPTVTPEPHWIPVTERLPEEETDVLVTVHFLGLKRTHRNGWNEHIKESFYVEVASHINGEWSSVSDEYKIAKDRHKVVAYMPLPEPYKGVTE